MRTNTKRLILAGVVWFASLVAVWLAFSSHRYLTGILALPLTGCCWWIAGTWRRAAIFGSISVAVFLIPVETTFDNVPGPPRLVPLVMGLLLDRHEFEDGLWTGFRSDPSGDWYAGGDVYTGVEPKWILVW
jgi:hypothetical protein